MCPFARKARAIYIFPVFYYFMMPLMMVLFVGIAAVVTVLLLGIVTPLLTLYCPYMAFRIIYFSLKSYK
jgi:hypothetical protein